MGVIFATWTCIGIFFYQDWPLPQKSPSHVSQSEPTPLGYLSGFGRWHAARSFWLLRIVYTCFQIKWIVDFHSFPYMLAIYSSLLPMSQQPRRPRSRGKHKQNKKLSAASKLGLAQLSTARSPKRPGVQSGATGEKMYLPVSSNVAMGSTYKCFFLENHL